MIECGDWDSLASEVDKKCRRVLNDNVAPIAKKIVTDHVIKDVYLAYKPKEGGWPAFGGDDTNTYERRGALLAPGSIYHTFTAPNEIMITSDAKVSKSVVKGCSFHHRRPGAFLQLLESGNVGIWAGGFPRPVIGNAQKEIDDSQEIRRAILSGLNDE